MSPRPPATAPRRTTHAFTLVELLVAMSILSILLVAVVVSIRTADEVETIGASPCCVVADGRWTAGHLQHSSSGEADVVDVGRGGTRGSPCAGCGLHSLNEEGVDGLRAGELDKRGRTEIEVCAIGDGAAIHGEARIAGDGDFRAVD